MVSGARLRQESMHREVEARERERAAAREARLREQIADAEEAAERRSVHSLAEEDFKQMKGRAMTEDTQIDFIDPKDFKLASVVSERAGRTYYADGSYSVQLNEIDYYNKEELHKLYLPNGVTRLFNVYYKEPELLREELPDGSVKEYNGNGSLEYWKDADGNYSMYDEGRVTEEGDKNGWIARYPNEKMELQANGDYKKYNRGEEPRYVVEEGNINGEYQKFDEHFNVLEKGNHKTGEYEKYDENENLIESGTYDKERFDKKLIEYDGVTDKICFENGVPTLKIMTLGKGEFSENDRRAVYRNLGVRSEEEMQKRLENDDICKILRKNQRELHSEYEARLTFKPKADGSGLYLAESSQYAWSDLRRLTYDELGRCIEKRLGQFWRGKYTYHGDTDLLETKYERRTCGNSDCWLKYDILGRIVEEGTSPDVFVRKTYRDERIVSKADKRDDRVVLEEKVDHGKVVSLRHYDEKGKDDTFKFRARKRVAQRQAEKSEKMRNEAKEKGKTPKRTVVKKLNSLEKRYYMTKAYIEMMKEH